MDIAIEAKMSNGSHYIFDNMDNLSRWLEKMRLELDENGWSDHNEFTQRIVAYLVNDLPDDPSCELLIYSPIAGQAQKFIVDDENSF